MRRFALIALATVANAFAPRHVVQDVTKALRAAEAAEETVKAEAKPAGPPATIPWDESKVIKVDASPMCKYITRAWSKSDDVAAADIADMLKDPANLALLDAVDEAGSCALSLAASSGKPRVVEALLAAGANPNVVLGAEWDVKDVQPLFRAVEEENLDAVTQLVEAGAEINRLNARLLFTGTCKMTAAQRAKDLGAKQVLKYLESKGGTLEQVAKPLSGGANA